MTQCKSRSAEVPPQAACFRGCIAGHNLSRFRHQWCQRNHLSVFRNKTEEKFNEHLASA